MHIDSYKVFIKIIISLSITSLLNFPVIADSFTAFESGQVRPLALSPDGQRLYAVNTPDNRLEIFDVNAGMPNYAASVNVGLEPVVVAVRNNNEVWVANYLSDSISIIDTSSTPPRVIRTLLVGDEPGDIVFAGPGGNRAFITTAHRGQNTPYMQNQDDPAEMTISVGRADVWVFDANNLGSSLGGDPETIITLFGDTPKALTVSPDGNTVYAAIFKSGNQTTVLNENIVCDGGALAVPCITSGGATAPGGLPSPNVDKDGIAAPEVGLIVRYDGSQWIDELNRDWSDFVKFSLPDNDVFAIDATANPPVETDAFASVGTVLFNMAVNPVSGKIYVANTEANNEIRFEGSRPMGNTTTTIQGRVHQAHITIIDPVSGSVTPRHLNKHIDYSVSPAPAGVKDKTLAIPKGMAVTANGNTLYVVAKGSAKIGVFDTAELEADTFIPDTANQISLSAGGPDGLVLDEANDRIYVTTRFDNGLSVINTVTKTEVDHLSLYNPEPASIVAGRPFLFDANFSSSNGESACASCHVEGDRDELAWDLGNPEGSDLANLNGFFPPAAADGSRIDFHPMKGPMTVRTFRGMADNGPLHWRGDRSGANNSSDHQDVSTAFNLFNVSFEDILGRSGPPTVPEMQAFTDFILQVIPPPNPIRALDDSLTTKQQAGATLFNGAPATLGFQCQGCHAPPNGTSDFSATVSQTQAFKIPSLRNLYQKAGMFGMPDIDLFNGASLLGPGAQIRGFGFLHDGSVDIIENFLHVNIFDGLLDPLGNSARQDLEQFIFAFDSNLKPVVGQQVTLSSTNASVVDSRIDLLVARTQAGDSDLIVKWNSAGHLRGAYMQAGNTDDNFETDKAAEAAMSISQIRLLANTSGQEVTYTAVPVSSGLRMGIDRDEDTVLDGDDNCPSIANLTQIDTDANGVGDACESNIDSDGDSLTDVEETIVFGTNPLLADSDSDGLNDDSEFTKGTDPLNPDSDGDHAYDGDEVSADTDPLNFADTDFDGMSDDWETVFGTNPAGEDTLQDADNDGYSNIWEYLGYSDPQDSASAPNGNTIYVDVNNASGVEDGLTVPTAFNTIQEGISAAQDGDTVEIAAGTYTPTTSFFFYSKSVRLLGAGADTTVLSVLAFVPSTTEVVWSKIEGLTIQASSNIYLSDIRNMEFQNCRIDAVDGSELINNARAKFTNCQLYGGTGVSDVGIDLNTDADLILINSTLTSYEIGIVQQTASSILTIHNSILSNTVLDIVPGLDGSGISYSMISDGKFSGSNGNISGVPNFMDPATNDYHLQPGSAAIDAGDPADDMTNEIQPHGCRINMGAYGNTNEAAFSSDPDSDGDELTDNCEMLLGTDINNPDSDNDGLTDYEEVCYDGNCSSYNPYNAVTNPGGGDTDVNLLDTDDDGFNDGEEVTFGSDPLNVNSTAGLASGDINGDGIVNVVDVMLAQKIIIGDLMPDTNQVLRGNVAPLSGGVPVPNGVFDLGDMLIIMRKASGEISF